MTSAPCPSRRFQAVGNRIHGENPAGAEQLGAGDGELADRAATEDHDRVASLDIGDVGGEISGREYVG